MNNFWREPRTPITIEQVITALELAGEYGVESTGGASPDTIAEAERRLGYALSADMRTFYATFDGGSFVQGNLALWPLLPKSDEVELTITTASDLMRSWQWPIPPELLVIASDGSDGHFGLWIGEPPIERPLAIEIGETDEPNGMAVVGDDFTSFLLARCGYHLVMNYQDGEISAEALDKLGIPGRLREVDPWSDTAYFDFLNWASPNLPNKTPDPYDGMTAEQINAFVRGESSR